MKNIKAKLEINIMVPNVFEIDFDILQGHNNICHKNLKTMNFHKIFRLQQHIRPHPRDKFTLPNVRDYVHVLWVPVQKYHLAIVLSYSLIVNFWPRPQISNEKKKFQNAI